LIAILGRLRWRIIKPDCYLTPSQVSAKPFLWPEKAPIIVGLQASPAVFLRLGPGLPYTLYALRCALVRVHEAWIANRWAEFVEQKTDLSGLLRFHP
jgi:hypothetical protein